MTPATRSLRWAAALLLALGTIALGQSRPADPPAGRDLLAPATAPATRPGDADPIALIRDEGLNRSRVMDTLSYLADVIGPRLTGSPNLRRANEWTRDQMAGWGMANAALEPWGAFGRGWSLERFSMQVVEPQAIPLIGYPRAWSPGFDRPVLADVVHVEGRTEAEFEALRGKLRGAVVLLGRARDVEARFEPLANRLTDSELLRAANAAGEGGDGPPAGLARSATAADRRAMLAGTPAGRVIAGATRPAGDPGTAPATGPAASRPAQPVLVSQGRAIALLMREGAAMVVTPSSQGDGGTLFVAAAVLPLPVDQPATNPATEATTRPATPSAATSPTSGPATGPARRPAAWALDAPATLPQVTLAAEHYNRLVRMLGHGVPLKAAVDLRVAFHDDDPTAHNTVAEIPGTDLADEVVMLGAHLDSWHAGTGTTDNGAGVAAVMEAARILQATKLRPRRTIRVALWTGEEQGLYGSAAYVREHFGYYEDGPATGPATRPAGRRRAGGGPASRPASGPASRAARRLVRRPGYDRLSAYFNLDYGTGRIRGVYLEGNDAARPALRRWLAPFADLGATTISSAGVGGTDHRSFTAVGLPGFQFIQDPVEYWTRTHHSNADVFERAQAEDLKQAATILAAVAYQAAVADERVPRRGEE